MCNCIGMARTFDEENLHGVPPSNHHPRCEDYKLVTYANISYGGVGGLIIEHNMVDEFLKTEVENGNDAEDYSVSDIQLTEDQYENLLEHEGF